MDRERLIRFITPWADVRPRYQLKIGDRVLGFDNLNTEALIKLAEEIRSDFWAERKINRANRAIWAAQAAAPMLQAAE